jgi:uncharacterized protein
MLEFDWDEENLRHIAAHDVTPEEAEFVIKNHPLDLGFQDWHDEHRFQEAGATAQGRILVVVTTLRPKKIRVVTAYDAPPAVIREYFDRR